MVPNTELIKLVNNCEFLLKVAVKSEKETTLRYDINGKTNLLAWQSEVSDEICRKMEARIEDTLKYCVGLGIPSSSIVTESKYIYIDDRNDSVNFLCIPVMKEKMPERIQKERPSENIEEKRSANTAKKENGYFYTPGDL